MNIWFEKHTISFAGFFEESINFIKVYKLSKRIYRKEAINNGLAAYRGYISEFKIEDDPQNYLLHLKVDTPKAPPEIVTGKLLNFILEESVEMNLIQT